MRPQTKKVPLEEGWPTKQKGIDKVIKILEGQTGTQISPEEYMAQYTTIYNICIQRPPHDYSEELYNKYKEVFQEYLTSTVLPILETKHEEFMLRELVERWHNHTVMVRWLSRFFYYLDWYYVPRRALPVLKEVGLTCFQEEVFLEMKGKVRDAVLSLIEKEREGEQIDRALLKNVLDIFVELGMGQMGMGQMDLYENGFEKTMLKDTSAYYSRKATNWILEDSCPDYMLKAEECLKREKDRVANYLHSSSEAKLLEKAQHELLSVHATTLLEKEQTGCHALLKDDKVDDLSRMFRLFSKIPRGLDLVSKIFKQHITCEGTALVRQAEDAAAASSSKGEERREVVVGLQEQVFVRNVTSLHDKYMEYVLGCFQNNTHFRKALKEAFEIFFNKGVAGSTSAELLATFCDNLLKKGSGEKLSDEAIEDTLEKIVFLLAYLADKDLFAEFCRKKLANRLLFGNSADEEHERSFLTKLKQQCGGQFTSKMEGMVTDWAKAREKQVNFVEYLNINPNAEKSEKDTTVTVLTTGFWPSYKYSDLHLPAELAKGERAFREFYQTRKKHRKLTFIYSLGSCIVNGKFDQKTIELVGSTPQAAALLLFNASDRKSFQEIMTELNIGEDETRKLLFSLSCAKYKILTKEPNTRTVQPTDVFEFNSKFTDRMRRIKLPRHTSEDRNKVVEAVDNDRHHAIEAAIVRIMKSRKVLGYQQLIRETVGQLSQFKPDVKEIKKRIEGLISREFLERDKENPSIFKYLA